MQFWPAILVMSGIALGGVLGCGVPFVAVAALAARTLSPRRAFAVVTAMWLGTETIGYGFKHFPHDPSTAAWGLVMLATTCAALQVARCIPVTALSFVAAFVAYESLQLAYALAVHDAVNFAPAIDAQIFVGNVLAIAILAAIRLTLTAATRAQSDSPARAARRT